MRARLHCGAAQIGRQLVDAVLPGVHRGAAGGICRWVRAEGVEVEPRAGIGYNEAQADGARRAWVGETDVMLNGLRACGEAEYGDRFDRGVSLVQVVDQGV